MSEEVFRAALNAAHLPESNVRPNVSEGESNHRGAPVLPHLKNQRDHVDKAVVQSEFKLWFQLRAIGNHRTYSNLLVMVTFNVIGTFFPMA